MGAGLILETTFVIDLEREVLRRQPGNAHAFLAAHSGDSLHLTFTVAGELAAGYGGDGRGRWEQLVAPFHVLPWSLDIAWQYGQADRYLRANGVLIGANDLWIAVTGLAYGMAVVTRNLRHYQRVPGLAVLAY